MITKTKSNFIIACIPVIYLIFILSSRPILPFSHTQFRTNMTTKCENGNCTTTLCVNDEPCKTTNSNSTNITSLDDLLKNKTTLAPTIPNEVVWIKNVFPVYETFTESKIKDSLETTDNPFEGNESTFLSIDSRVTQRKKREKKIKADSHIKNKKIRISTGK